MFATWARLSVLFGGSIGTISSFPSFQVSASNKKNDNHNADDVEWTLYFWKEKTRGNFIRLILEECDVKYNDIYDFDKFKNKFQSPTFTFGKYGVNYDNFKENKFQPFAPPLLLKPNDKDFMLSQTIIIVDYLSKYHNLCPKDINDRYKSLMIVQNCIDCFEEMVRFGTMMRYYDDQYNQETNQQRILYWFKNRLPTWMNIFVKPLDGNKSYYFQDRITESDLAVFNVLDGIKEFIGDDLFNEYIFNNPEYKNLKQHYNNMLKNSKGINKLYSRQEKNGFKWWIYEWFGSDDFLGINRCRNFLNSSLSE